MTTSTGSVTVHSANGAPVGTTGNSYASAHAAMFQNLTAAVASSGINTLPAGSNIVVQNDFGTVGIFASGTVGGASVVLVGDGTNLSYIGGSANTTLVGGNGSDTVLAGSGDNTIAFGNGSDEIYLGAGSSVVSVAGSNDFVQAGSGSASIALTGIGATVDGGYGGPLNVDDTLGTSSTLNVVNGTTIQVSLSSTTTINAYGDTTVDGGSGSNAQYNQTNGSLEFVGTGGTINVVAGPSASSSDVLYAGNAGASVTTIHLTSDTHNTVFVANDPVQGASGNAVLDGGSANGGNQFWAGSGNTTLIGGTGGDTMVAGGGSTLMEAKAGTATNYFDLFSDSTGGATQVTIEGFALDANNKLTLFGFGPSAAQAFIAGATQTTAGLSYTFTDHQGATVTLAGVTAGELNTSNVLST